MLAICINSGGNFQIENGKIYKIIGESKDDEGKPVFKLDFNDEFKNNFNRFYRKERFKPIPDTKLSKILYE